MESLGSLFGDDDEVTRVAVDDRKKDDVKEESKADSNTEVRLAMIGNVDSYVFFVLISLHFIIAIEHFFTCKIGVSLL
jgi:hypothetical protein